MGVDAQMLVRVPRAVSDEELKRWSYMLGSMCLEKLFLGYEERVFHKPLERIDHYEQDGDPIFPEAGETLLQIPLAGRYYGEAYERGDLLAYVGIATFVEILIPDCTIWYGGDSSGVTADLFDAKRRAELLDYAASHARDPYVHDHFSPKDGFNAPMCPVCDYEMPRCGFGPAYALFDCPACSWQVQYRDNVKHEGFNVSATLRRKAEQAAIAKGTV